MNNITAAGFISGGLDSILAVELMKKQSINIRLVNVINGFGQETMRVRADITRGEDEWKQQKKDRMEDKLGLPVEIIDISGEFLDTVLSPRYGHGKNINPCIDCKIDFFSIGREMMDRGEVDFIFTGEVLGQRPMSQNKRMMEVIEKRSGLEGYILRPLSGRIMKETVPEAKGWVDRDKFLDIQGRSRRRQMEAAREFGIEDYPAPAGGCLLTDVNFARRFNDLISFAGPGNITVEDTVALSVGRHFRLSEDARVIVGRDKSENDYLEDKFGDRWIFTAADVTGPAVVLFGDDSEEIMKKCASITARYCNDRDSEQIRVNGLKEGKVKEYDVPPADREKLLNWLV